MVFFQPAIFPYLFFGNLKLLLNKIKKFQNVLCVKMPQDFSSILAALSSDFYKKKIQKVFNLAHHFESEDEVGMRLVVSYGIGLGIFPPD